MGALRDSRGQKNGRKSETQRHREMETREMRRDSSSRTDSIEERKTDQQRERLSWGARQMGK